MNLLAEMNNIIKENADKTLNINGNLVSLQDMEVDHEYHPGQLLLHATLDSPEEYSDDETSALNVHSLTFSVKTKSASYTVTFDFKGNDYHEQANQLEKDMKSITPYILDDEDDEIKDSQTIYSLKNTCIQYVNQSGLIDTLYKEGNQKELSHNDNDDYNNDDYDRMPDYYDGTGRF